MSRLIIVGFRYVSDLGLYEDRINAYGSNVLRLIDGSRNMSTGLGLRLGFSATARTIGVRGRDVR